MILKQLLKHYLTTLFLLSFFIQGLASESSDEKKLKGKQGSFLFKLNENWVLKKDFSNEELDDWAFRLQKTQVFGNLFAKKFSSEKETVETVGRSFLGTIEGYLQSIRIILDEEKIINALPIRHLRVKGINGPEIVVEAFIYVGVDYSATIFVTTQNEFYEQNQNQIYTFLNGLFEN